MKIAPQTIVPKNLPALVAEPLISPSQHKRGLQPERGNDKRN
jgi:hypothetical protein